MSSGTTIGFSEVISTNRESSSVYLILWAFGLIVIFSVVVNMVGVVVAEVVEVVVVVAVGVMVVVDRNSLLLPFRFNGR